MDDKTDIAQVQFENARKSGDRKIRGTKGKKDYRYLHI
jgi:hypothetical protein